MLGQDAGEDDWSNQLLLLLVRQPTQQLAHGGGLTTQTLLFSPSQQRNPVNILPFHVEQVSVF